MAGTFPLTIPAALDLAAARFADHEAIVEGDVRWRFDELAVRARVAAAALVASGIDRGDRIGIWAPNLHEWVLAALGTHLAGAVVVPINTRFKGDEAAYVLDKAGVRLLFTVTDFLDTDYVAMLQSAASGVPPSIEEIVILRGAPSGAEACPWPAFLDRATGHDAEARQRAAAVSADDLCDILFTSGTTGAPKGAMLRHGASTRAFTAWCDVIGLEAGDRYLIVNPFFHAFGLKAGILACILTGATMVPHAVFDVASVVRRVEEERITMLPGAPTLYQSILNSPGVRPEQLATLRLAVTGAATIPVELIERMRRDLPFEKVVTGYGLTEATGIATMCRHDDDPVTIATTAGRPIPGVELRLVDGDGREVEEGGQGEVLVRGYNVMAGYFDDPEATDAAVDPDGWLHTGDVGQLDGTGNLRITDRIKDMFIVGGFNAYPAEIEQLLSQHEAVAAAAVVGIPDDRLGEVACAFVVPRSGAAVDPDELIAWCRARMANYKVPRRVEIVGELPLNASGKVLKYILREKASTT